MTLKKFRDLLLLVHDDVFHAESSKKDEYIVWKEVGLRCRYGDGEAAGVGQYIKVDFFTKSEYSEIPEQLVHVLSRDDEIAVRDVTSDYEPDTEYFHYSFLCEII